MRPLLPFAVLPRDLGHRRVTGRRIETRWQPDGERRERRQVAEPSRVPHLLPYQPNILISVPDA